MAEITRPTPDLDDASVGNVRMKQSKNITILGGGIMGLMTAYTLANAYNITLIDPMGFPADNASLMAGGMLAPYSEIEHMDMRWVDAGLRSIDIWKNMKLNTGFVQNGSLLIAHSEDRYILERFKSHLPLEKQIPQNTKDLEEQLTQHHEEGIFLSEEAHLDPTQTMSALCEYLKNHENVKLKNENKTKENDIVIDCRGMASNDPDIRGVKGETLIVRNPDFRLSRPVRLMHPRYPLYIIPRDNHHFMIGATVIESSDNQSTSLRSAMELMSALYSLHPSFGEAEIVSIKAGIRPSYPDNLPRITPNGDKISCNGLFRHGYLLAPIMAECVRDYIQGQDNEFMPLFISKGKSDVRQHQSHSQRAA